MTSFKKFVEDVLDKKYTLRLYIHTSQDKDECLRFWESYNFDLNQIKITINHRAHKKIHNHKEKYGVLCLSVKTPLGIRAALREYSYSH